MQTEDEEKVQTKGGKGDCLTLISWNKHSLESIKQGRKIDVKTWS